MLVETDNALQDELIEILPLTLFENQTLFSKFDSKDRARIAFLAGLAVGNVNYRMINNIKLIKATKIVKKEIKKNIPRSCG